MLSGLHAFKAITGKCRRGMLAVTTATVLIGTIIAFGISIIKQLFYIDEERIGQHSWRESS